MSSTYPPNLALPVYGAYTQVSPQAADLEARFGASRIFNVMDPAYGAVGDGATDDTVAIQAAITAAAASGGCVLFPSGKHYRASGLIIRSAAPVAVSAEGAVLVIKDATAPYCTMYGVRHRWTGGQFIQQVSTDHCQALLWTNDATTPVTTYCVARDVWCYSVYQALTVTMVTAGISGGTAFRQYFDGCVIENYTQQKTWAGSYGVKLTGDAVGNAGGNDTKLHACLVKGYETNVIVQNSADTVLDDCSLDGGGTAIRYDAGSGLTVIGGYLEYNDTVFALVNTPNVLLLLGPSITNYTTVKTGTLLNSAPLSGFDKYGTIVGNVPLMGGDTGSGLGVTRFTGVNEVGFAIGTNLDKVIRWIIDATRLTLDTTLLTGGVDVWIKKTDGRFLIGNPTGNWVAWDAANNRFEVPAGEIDLNAASSLKILVHNGNPNGVVTADPGSLVLNAAGGAGTSLYVKESGTGNTGWVAK